jgi:ABC-type transport system substrate-binding protein
MARFNAYRQRLRRLPAGAAALATILTVTAAVMAAVLAVSASAPATVFTSATVVSSVSLPASPSPFDPGSTSVDGTGESPVTDSDLVAAFLTDRTWAR